MKELHEMQAALDTLRADFDEYRRKAELKAKEDRKLQMGDVYLDLSDPSGFDVCGYPSVPRPLLSVNQSRGWRGEEESDLPFAFNVFDVSDKLRQHAELVAAVRELLDAKDQDGDSFKTCFESDLQQPLARALVPAARKLYDLITTEPTTDHE